MSEDTGDTPIQAPVDATSEGGGTSGGTGPADSNSGQMSRSKFLKMGAATAVVAALAAVGAKGKGIVTAESGKGAEEHGSSPEVRKAADRLLNERMTSEEIQNLINGAEDGAIFEFEAGDYRNLTETLVITKDNLTFRGSLDGEARLDGHKNDEGGGRPGHQIFKGEGVSVTFEDLTLQNGQSSGKDAHGAGIGIDNSEHPDKHVEIRRTKFIKCDNSDGGGLSVEGGSVNIDECVFEGCEADFQYADGTNNHGGGGGVMLKNTRANVMRTTFDGCRSIADGGALCADKTELKVSGCMFKDGISGGNGAGINANSCEVTVDHVIFNGGLAEGSGGGGAANFATCNTKGDTWEVVDCTSTSGADGINVFSHMGETSTFKHISMGTTEGTVARGAFNVRGMFGNVVKVEISDVVVAGYTRVAAAFSNSQFTYSHTAIGVEAQEKGAFFENGGTVVDGGDNVNLVDNPYTSDGCHVNVNGAGSALVGAGSVTTEANTTDLDGNVREVGKPCTIGCYEVTGVEVKPTPTVEPTTIASPTPKPKETPEYPYSVNIPLTMKNSKGR